jgi:hypothetical protein
MDPRRVRLEDVLRSIRVTVEQIHVRRRRGEVEEEIAVQLFPVRARVVTAQRELDIVARPVVEIDSQVGAIVSSVVRSTPSCCCRETVVKKFVFSPFCAIVNEFVLNPPG